MTTALKPHDWRGQHIYGHGFAHGPCFVCASCGQRFAGDFRQWLAGCPGQRDTHAERYREVRMLGAEL